jgi:basic amino acid/polyamine antiporter, APA family
MATSDAPDSQTLFARKATGLVRGWSQFDGFLYAFLVGNTIIGLWVLSFAPFIADVAVFWAILLCVAFVALEVIVYAAWVAVVPRAGGDYVWQTRVFGGSVGFVLAATGWWFILWHWVPIYANITVIAVVDPVLRIFGADGTVSWLTGETGVFVSSLVVIALASAYVGLGMRGYAKVQRWTFFIGMAGLAVAALFLLFSSKSDFIGAFNREAADMYGVKGNAYQDTLKAGGTDWPGVFGGSLEGAIKLVPFLLFFLLWPNWGATLAGEVRGVTSFWRNVRTMGLALALSGATALAFVVLISKTMGWDFFMAASNSYWGGTSPLPDYPAPVMFAAWLVDSPVVQFLVITAAGMLVLSWYGSVFLSSSRMIFAAAFDRVLPEWAASVSARTHVPYVALACMAVPSVLVSALYAYWGGFATYTLDATLVIAITYLGTTLAGIIMPWRLRRAYEASPVAGLRIGPLPLVSAAGVGFAAFLVVNLVLWLRDDVYGINNSDSLIYMGVLYLLAIAIYAVAVVVRRREGMGLEAVQREIPFE